MREAATDVSKGAGISCCGMCRSLGSCGIRWYDAVTESMKGASSNLIKPLNPKGIPWIHKKMSRIH